MVRPEDILAFWLDETGPEGWYKAKDALDTAIRDRFGEAWEAAVEGSYGLWLTYPTGALAYIILTDQFPRNMFRGSGRAFASDHLSRAVAKRAIDRDWDLRIDEPARQFFYLPLMHSENLADQDRCKAHRQVIREFGRFPYRNEALSRRITTSEASYLEKGGYGHTVRELQAAG